MIEGKHIHFSPSDNKPLCSYSSKLCRQRRLNGYGFCIRHILEDKSAPFKRCTYVTRNNNQICQNAIPTDRERGYCHSHMQVAGIIPKTERKVKNNGPTKGGSSGGETGLSSSSSKSDSNSNSSSNSTGIKKDPNAVFKFEEEHSEIQWIPKGGSINGIVNGGKVQIITTAKGKKGADKTTSKATKKNNGNEEKGFRRQLDKKNGKIQPSFSKSEKKPKKSTTTSNSKGKKEKTLSNNNSNAHAHDTKLPNALKPKTTINTNTSASSAVITLTGRNSELSSSSPLPSSLSTATFCSTTLSSSVCMPENEKLFNQLKTLKSVETSILQTVVTTKPTDSSSTSNSKPTIYSPRTISATLDIEQNENLTQDCTTTNLKARVKTSIENLNCNVATSSTCDGVSAQNLQRNSQISSPPSFLSAMPSVSRGSTESRQEFLNRVRHTFKLHHLSIKNATNDSERSEKIWKRALRNSLLTCILKDSSYCAHVLVQSDSLKYSASPDDVKNSSKDINKKGKKNCEAPEDFRTGVGRLPEMTMTNGKTPSISSSFLLSEPIINEFVKYDDNSLLLSGSKKKGKGSKRKQVSDIMVVDDGRTLNTTKTKNTKKRSNNTPSDLNTDFHVGDSIKNNYAMNGDGKNGLTLPHLQSGNLNSKKRKQDASLMCNGNGNVLFKPLNPADGDSADSKTKLQNGQNGQLVFNNFNGHISHHPLLHPHSGLATTASLKSNNSTSAQAQLQQLLSQPDLRSLGSSMSTKHARIQGMDTVLNSMNSSEIGTSDGVITDASFDSTFDHSVSGQPDCEFSDEDLEKSLEFQIDPETEHQASRLLEENEITEDDLNELFPETTNKLGRSSDLSDFGVDLTSAFDANDNDIDYSLFANIFPFTRSNQTESISVSNQY